MNYVTKFGDFSIVGKDVLGIIVKHIAKGSRCNFICTNSTIMNLILERIWKPWIPVKNYLTTKGNHNYYFDQITEIENTGALGLGLLFAIKNCNYDYYFKWKKFAGKKFKTSWQNGILYNYALKIISEYNKNNDNHIRLFQQLMKDKFFKKFIRPCTYNIMSETLMEWLCKTGNYEKFYYGNTLIRSPVNVIKIYIKYFPDEIKNLTYTSISFNLDFFEFLLENYPFKITYRHIFWFCHNNHWEKAYKYLSDSKYSPSELDSIKTKQLFIYIKNRDYPNVYSLISNISE
jgi:hypothetical protein